MWTQYPSVHLVAAQFILFHPLGSVNSVDLAHRIAQEEKLWNVNEWVTDLDLEIRDFFQVPNFGSATGAIRWEGRDFKAITESVMFQGISRKHSNTVRIPLALPAQIR